MNSILLPCTYNPGVLLSSISRGELHCLREWFRKTRLIQGGSVQQKWNSHLIRPLLLCFHVCAIFPCLLVQFLDLLFHLHSGLSHQNLRGPILPVVWGTIESRAPFADRHSWFRQLVQQPAAQGRFQKSGMYQVQKRSRQRFDSLKECAPYCCRCPCYCCCHCCL